MIIFPAIYSTARNTYFFGKLFLRHFKFFSGLFYIYRFSHLGINVAYVIEFVKLNFNFHNVFYFVFDFIHRNLIPLF